MKEMDCCNYMQYRQPYYGSNHQYYESRPPYLPGDYYAPQMYSDFYNAQYYPQPWPPISHFPDYVYNPKEARIRKAMREATRDRSIGASPMLPRPSARHAAHDWNPQLQEEQLMMSPMGGMRALDSTLCNFPISTTGSNQFMPPMNGYSKLDTSMTSNGSLHSNYMQPSPLAHLQHQSDMWHYHHDNLRPRSGGNPYMIPEMNLYHNQSKSPETNTNHIMDKSSPPAIHSMNGSTNSHVTESIPVDNLPSPKEVFDNKPAVESVINEPKVNLTENVQDTFNISPFSNANVMPPHPYEQHESARKKDPLKKEPMESIFLPLSHTNFCVPPEILSHNTKYHASYIGKYFQGSYDYNLVHVHTADGSSFPYVTLKGEKEVNYFLNYLNNNNSEPSLVPTDIGYIPVLESNSSFLI